MKVCIIGTGYVGLVTGACFAKNGNTVFCVDHDEQKIHQLQDGVLPIFEPGLEEIVKNNVQKNRLIFTTDLGRGINNADISFIAVGTPQDADGSANLNSVRGVCEKICEVAKKRVVIATKSTVPVGTGDEIEEIFRARLKQPFLVFSNPEFLKEGDAVNDFLKPDRIIVGTNDEGIVPMVKELYGPFTRQRERILFMDRRSAEITKYASNAMLALRISFMNEVANFCDAVGANVNDVRRGVGADSRIGPAFLYPGLGFGGSCFPKDVKALIRVAKNSYSPMLTLEACEESNAHQTRRFFSKITRFFGEHLQDRVFALWGLAFKANTDDIRESKSLELLDLLLEHGATVRVHDPCALAAVRRVYGGRILYCEENMEALVGAHALVVATDWNLYRSPDLEEIRSKLKEPVIFDGRNLFDARTLRDLGFHYFGVGC